MIIMQTLIYFGWSMNLCFVSAKGKKLFPSLNACLVLHSFWTVFYFKQTKLWIAGSPSHKNSDRPKILYIRMSRTDDIQIKVTIKFKFKFDYRLRSFGSVQWLMNEMLKIDQQFTAQQTQRSSFQCKTCFYMQNAIFDSVRLSPLRDFTSFRFCFDGIFTYCLCPVSVPI